jgi:antitoxin component YwqK of YwqJK toxin-antitoxin module
MIHLITTMNRPCLHFEFNEAWVLAGDAGSETKSEVELMRSSARSIREVRTQEERYPNGTIRLHHEGGTADDGRFLLHGSQGWYYPNGRLQYEARYELGRKVGTETFWSADGSRLWQWQHQPDGVSVWTQFWPNGAKRAESSWRGFLCDGLAILWDQDGKVASETRFREGLLQPAE